MKAVANSLAELVSDIRFSKLPEEVVKEIKRRILDALGCAFGGFHGEPSVIMRNVAADLGGKPESTLLGAAYRTSCEKAALVNSTMLRYLDYMDSHAGPDACHPCFNIPPCLAVAERVSASGKDLIAAIVAGYEIQIRFQDACKIGSRGWFSGTYLEFSVPLAVGKLLGLDIDRLTNALAIAATHANALSVNSRTIPASKSIADAMVASTGILGALMAQAGLTGPTDILDSGGEFEKAVAMVDGELGPEQYADAKLRDPNVLSVIDRTTLQSDASLDQHWPEAAVSRVVLRTKNGQSCEATTLYPPGHHKNRVTDELIQQKFTKLTSQVLGKDKQAAIIQTVGRLEELESVKELTIHLGGDKRG